MYFALRGNMSLGDLATSIIRRMDDTSTHKWYPDESKTCIRDVKYVLVEIVDLRTISDQDGVVSVLGCQGIVVELD